MSGIKLIAGLGNPGQQYRYTRHNAGAMFLESLADDYRGELKAESKFLGLCGRIEVKAAQVWLLFPTTFMNLSGQSVAALASYYKISPEEILVVYDELDLPVGSVRLKFGGGHGGHNGIRDIIKALGTPDFHRLRIGIGHPGEASQVHNYVLSEPHKDDAEFIQDAIDKAIGIIPLMTEGEFQKAMHTLHSKDQ